MLIKSQVFSKFIQSQEFILSSPMGRTQFGLMLWAAMALFSCKRSENRQIEVTGRLMKSSTVALEGASLELIEMRFVPNGGGLTETILETAISGEGGKFRFTYEQNTRELGGLTCDDQEEGLYLRNAETGKYYFKCFPTNEDIAAIIYTGTSALLRLQIADTIGAGDTFFFPYPPMDSNNAHFINITDTAGFTYPYFFLVGPLPPQSVEYETYFNNSMYEGFLGSHHGEEIYQWFIKGDSTYHFGLENWRPKGLPYRDSILLHNLYR